MKKDKTPKEYPSETTDKIIASMDLVYEKAKQIRHVKEQENALFVQQKLDQKWRSECDELRTFQSK